MGGITQLHICNVITEGFATWAYGRKYAKSQEDPKSSYTLK